MDFRISERILDLLQEDQESRTRFEVMKKVLTFLREKGERLVFKGGSAITFFYRGERFSEDLDFDAYVDPKKFSARGFAKQLAEHLGLEVSVVKDTETTKRLKVKVPGLSKDVKIEISFRKLHGSGQARAQKGFEVYSIDEIAKTKLKALEGRVTARDLYDVAFILNFWLRELSTDTLKEVSEFFKEKDVESWMESFEEAFVNDSYLGESEFYQTYGRLVSGLARVKLALEKKERKKNFFKNQT